MANEINIMVGGEAGQGVQSVGFLLAKALTRWAITSLRTRIMNPECAEDITSSVSGRVMSRWKQSMKK